MGGYEIGFDRPWYLLGLLCLPVLWAMSYQSLAGLGPWRRLSAMGLRSLVVTGIVLALAEVQLLRTSDSMTVVYLLDQSQSIPADKRQAMLDYVVRDVRRHRQDHRNDKAGVVVFGADAKVEFPPFDDQLPSIGRLESTVHLRTDATSLESALKLAKALFPEDSARRVVVVTDGNENLGDAQKIARAMAEDGIGIDTVAITLPKRSEVSVEKISIPTDLRKGQTFEARIVVNHQAVAGGAETGGNIKGKLRLTQSTDENEQLVAEQEVELAPGKNVFPFKHQIDRSAMFTYRATFVPDDPTQDQTPQNNEATAYTHVRGKGRVLLIEDWKQPGQFDTLVESLRRQNLTVKVQASDRLFTSPAELLQYDTVVLANVPRTSGDTADQTTSFSEAQIKMLVRNSEEMGCGLVMIGGPSSFGVGGWSNTELEKAMPVDFQIRNKRVEAVGALVLIMHASEMADGNYWQKKVGVEAIKTLGAMDFCGVVQWNSLSGGNSWLWKSPSGLDRVSGNRQMMLRRVQRMMPGDMPDFEPGMRLALSGFSQCPASVKHMIIISDGDPSPPSQALLSQFKQQGVMISTVAIGAHGSVGSTPLEEIATTTGGKYYVVTNPKALPKIYQREARRVARPLIHENKNGIRILAQDANTLTGITQGIPADSLLPVNAYVQTTIKQNALVEQLLIADQPADRENATILATWRYGLGRTTVFTTDAGARWATDWSSQPYYDKLFGQMIRHSMRPINEDANFTLASQYQDGKVSIVVTALDKEDNLLNFLQMSGRVIGPELRGHDISIKQEAPGRYVGQFDASRPGSYLFSIFPGEGFQSLAAGVNVPASSEFTVQQTNEVLLDTLAGLTPRKGEPGQRTTVDLSEAGIQRLLQEDTFRHNLARAQSRRDAWHWLVVLGAAIFFGDVLVRRVNVHFDWLAPWISSIWAKVFRREQADVAPQRMERLQNQKAAIAREIEQKRATARFEPQADLPADAESQVQDLLTPPAEPGGRERSPSQPTMGPAEAEEESYTSRLLAAKRKATKERRSTDE